jgi:hypothetical protein
MGVFIRDLSSEATSYQQYLQYLDSVKQKLLPSAYEYGAASWHYDLSHPKCIHDAWLRTLAIEEICAETPQSSNISATFLNAFEDRLLSFSYRDVVHYKLSTPGKIQAHGEVYFDEVRLSDQMNVVHEILFMNDIRWVIECKEFSFGDTLFAKT